jgi:lysophospholipase L1-like esterase
VLRAPRSYVAIGDSYCAGLETDSFEPWPVLVAEQLRAASPDLEFLSLAKYGATTAEILADQLPRSLAASPDLITVSCGANDVLLRTRPDLPNFSRSFAALLAGLREAHPAATVLTLTYGEFAQYMPFRPRSRARVAVGMGQINERIRHLSREAGCQCADIGGSPDGRRADSFGADGVHASRLGHVRTADAVIAAVRG